MRRLIAVLLVLALMPLGVWAQESQSMETFAENAFRVRNVSGGAVAIAWKGKVLFRYAYGSRDAWGKEPVTVDTCFRVASVTKLVSAIGLLHLMEEKNISLDAPVNDYLPFPVTHPAYPEEKITFRQLLSHTSGMEQTQTYFPHWESLPLDTKYFNAKIAPGTQYNYANLNGGLIGALIEAISGQSLNSYMQQHIFDPLQINAAYHPALLQNTEDIADQLKKDGSLVQRAEKALETIADYDDTCSPRQHTHLTTGKLYISVSGLIRIISLVQRGGEFGGVRILSETMVQEMMAQQCEIPGSSVTGESPYGLCLHRVTGLPGGTWYGHQGRYEGMAANIYFQPDTGLSLAVIGNGYNSRTEHEVTTLALAFMEKAQEFAREEETGPLSWLPFF